MCDSWQKPREDELTLAEIERIYRELPRLDAVRLTGGEPFVRSDLGDIAALAVRHLSPMLLHVTTNGFQTSAIERFCETRDRSVPLALLVSIDGYGEKHSEIRGKASAWARTRATIEALAPRRRELSLRLAVNQTLVDASALPHYRLLGAWLAELDVPHHAVFAYAESATYSIRRERDVAPRFSGELALFRSIDEATLGTLIDELEAGAARLPLPERIAKTYYLRGARARLLRDRPLESPRCVALGAHLRLFPNGDVPTCQFNTRVVGNLRAQSFGEVWSSAARAGQRAWVSACAGCWAECEVLPSALYTGDIAREAARVAW